MAIKEAQELIKNLRYIARHRKQPDLHSFTAQYDGGTVIVEAQEDGFKIEYFFNGGGYTEYAGSVESAFELLLPGIDVWTIEI